MFFLKSLFNSQVSYVHHRHDQVMPHYKRDLIMKTLYLHKTKLALAVVSAMTLAACGSSNDNTEPEPTLVMLDATVMDGYLVKADVFLDLNGNNIPDTGEPTAQSGEHGIVSLDVTDIADPDQFSLVVKAIAGQTIDEDQPGITIEETYSMTAPAGNIVVSPVTTLIQLAIAADNTLSIEAASQQVATDLGLTAEDATNLLGDYIKAGDDNSEADVNDTIQAIARNITQALPEELTAEMLTAETLEQINKTAQVVAEAVMEAVTNDSDPDNILVVVDDSGEPITHELDVFDAKAFLADVRTWGKEIQEELDAGSEGFGGKIDAAAELVDADIEQLVSILDAFASALVEQSMSEAGIPVELDVAAVMTGATGTATVTLDEALTQLVADIDITVGTNTVQTQLTLARNTAAVDEKVTASIAVTGLLENDKVSLAIGEGSKLELSATVIAIDTDGFPSEVDLSSATFEQMFAATLTAKTTDTAAAIAFSGELASKAVAVASVADPELVIPMPTMLSLSGEFTVGEAESFKAALNITADPADFLVAQADDPFLETADSWIDVAATFTVDAKFVDAEDAKIILTVDRTALDAGEITVELSYGDRKVELSGKSADESGMIKITNAQGIVMTLNTLAEDNSVDVGALYLAAGQVAIIRLVDGNYTIHFNDGSFESLF